MGGVCGIGEAQVNKSGSDKIAKEECRKKEADDFNKAIKEHQGGADAGADAAKKTVSNATRLVTHTDAQLRELAKWPAQAHAEWNKLTQPERIAVFENISKLYGGDFAKKFLEFTKSGSRQDGA